MGKAQKRCGRAYARHRSTVTHTTPSVTYGEWWTVDGGTPAKEIWKIAPEIENAVVMSDYVTPCFKEKSAKGAIINSPMTRVTSVVTDEPSNYNTLWYKKTGTTVLTLQSDAFGLCPRAFVGSGEAHWRENPVPDPSGLQAARDDSASQAYAHVYDLSKAALLTDLAEAKETLVMLRHPLTRAYQLARESLYVLRHEVGHTRNKRLYRILTETPGTAVGTYLETRFGWGPLLKSLEDALSAYQSLQQRAGTARHTGRGFATTNGSFASSQDLYEQWTSDTDPFLATTCGQTVDTQYEIRSGVLANVTWDSPIAQSFGLTVWDVIPTAWDLIPLSFVVDRFLHVGDWLNYQARRFNPNVEILSSWRTERVVTHADRYVEIHSASRRRPAPLNSYFTRSGGEGHTKYDTDRVTRTPGLPCPSLPVLDIPESISLYQTLDYLALGYQSLAHKLSQLRRRR